VPGKGTKETTMTTHAIFEKTLAKSDQWLTELQRELAVSDPQRALRALRAGLHAIRDRLPVAEAADLAAELPMLIRGLYYEGWVPAGKPVPIHHPVDLLAMVSDELDPDTRLDAAEVLRAVIRLLDRHISRGELDDIVRTLPEPIGRLWVDNLA
jgi:uncharacterized protein (DUF2267 family)